MTVESATATPAATQTRHLVAANGAPIVTLAMLLKLVPRSRVSIYRDMARGDFPLPFKIGPKINYWYLADIEAHIANLRGSATNP